MPTSANIEAILREASILREAGRFGEAVQAYQAALAIDPARPTSWYNLGFCQRKVGLLEAALQSYQLAIDLGLTGPEEAHLNRAVILTDGLRREGEAEIELKRALAANPNYVPALLNLGNLAEDLGNRTEATALYRRVLSIDPECWDALARYANVLSNRPDLEAVVVQLRNGLARSDVKYEARASLGFALGRALDKIERYDAAFEAYREANHASRAGSPAVYDQAAADDYADRIMRAFSSPSDVVGEPVSWAPIFICGMFRSGSTLLEQVLAGHRRITPCGEMGLAPALITEALSPFPERAASTDSGAMRALAHSYRGRVERLFPNADLVTDKWLGNFFYVGAIKRMFPSAKIVHTVRHPLDNILSVFFLHVDASQAYAFDLEDIGHQLRLSRRLMAHWRAIYPGDVIEFRYDEFVSHPRETVGQLLQDLGLDWDETCLEFHKRSNAVKTASVWQVREPLYATSSGRWRNYERQLAHLRAHLSDLI